MGTPPGMYPQLFPVSCSGVYVLVVIQGNGQEKTTAWSATETFSVLSDTVFTFNGHTTLNQILLMSEIDLSAVMISSNIEIKFARTDSVSGDVRASFFDGHFQFDMLGSDNEYVKIV